MLESQIDFESARTGIASPNQVREARVKYIGRRFMQSNGRTYIVRDINLSQDSIVIEYENRQLIKIPNILMVGISSTPVEGPMTEQDSYCRNLILLASG